MFTFESARSFSIFSYNVGHGLLLLRSGKTTTCSTRLDLLIQDVRVMEIRSWFHGIRIEEVDAAYLDGYASKPAELMELGNRVYALHGAGWQGFVVGGIVSVHEDEEDFMEPSALLGVSESS